MRFGFGKYEGKTVTRVMVDDPLYIGWCLRKLRWPDVLDRIKSARRSFDAKPFVVNCRGHDKCGNKATRITLYASTDGGVNLEPYYWCDECDPCSLGASPHKLTVLRTYSELVNWAHVHEVSRAGTRKLVRKVTRAKGAPKKLTQGALDELFWGRGGREAYWYSLGRKAAAEIRAAEGLM